MSWTYQTKNTIAISEIDFLFSDGSDFLFSDGTDYLFREFAENPYIYQNKNSALYDYQTKN